MEILEALFSVFGDGIKESYSGTQYRFDCPKCFGPRKLNAKNKYPGPFICNSCGYTGCVITLIDHTTKPSFIVEEDQEVNWQKLTFIYTKVMELGTAREYHIDWLKNRGIVATSFIEKCNPSLPIASSDNVITKLKSEFALEDLMEAGLLVKRDGLYFRSGVLGQNRIIIPYFDPYEHKCVYIRSRFAGECDYYKYLAPTKVPGKDMSWGWHAYDDKGYLIVTEGELKAQSAVQLGLPCIALPGMQTGYSMFAEVCKRKNVSDVYIMFDTDTRVVSSTGVSKQLGVDSCVDRLSSVLKTSGINSYKCVLPTLGKKKMDIDEFILKSGNEARKKLLEVIRKASRIL